MGIFNKIKSLFIVEEEEGVPLNHTQNTKRKVEEKAPVNKTTAPEKTVSSGDMQKFSDILYKAIEKANQPGYDYLEFRQSIKNLKNQNIAQDEGKLYEAAYALAQTMQLDKQQLIESARYYLSVLQDEKANFNESLMNNAKVKLEDKKKKLAEVKAKLLEDKKALEALQKRIAANEKTLAKMTKELSEAASKVEAIKNGFNTALKVLVQKINDDINKMKKYINS